MSKPSFAVVGSGRWGSAVAIYLGRIGYETLLHCRDPARAERINADRRSDSLPDFPFPPGVKAAGGDLAASLRGKSAAIFSTPVKFFEATLRNCGDLPPNLTLMGVNKGIDEKTLRIPPQIAQSIYPRNPYAQLSGPCFPEGLLLERMPAAETLACSEPEVGRNLQKTLSSKSFRVYLSNDLNGVAYLGAIKNVYAMAAGMLESLGLSEESLSILVTRALAELRRFCKLMHISEETLYGLAGLGDMALTCYSRKSSQNKKFGGLAAKSGSVEKAVEAMNGKTAEGFHTLNSLKRISDGLNLEMPIVNALHGIFHQGRNAERSLSELMSRPLKMED